MHLFSILSTANALALPLIISLAAGAVFGGVALRRHRLRRRSANAGFILTSTVAGNTATIAANSVVVSALTSLNNDGGLR